MTLLSFFQFDEGFEVLTDTLATTTDNVPYQFVDKVFLYPSRRMAMAGTGSADLVNAWDRTLRENVLALDLQQIDRFATGAIQNLWAELREHLDFSERMTATIYHFGLISGTDRALRAIYRSKNEFASEVHDDRVFAIKPEPTTPRLPNDEAEWIELAGEVRSQQASLPVEAAITIGGELVLTTIGPEGLTQRVVHRYPDYAEQWNAMNQRRLGDD